MCCCDLGSRRKGKTRCVMGKGDGRVNAQMLKWVLQWKASEHVLLEIQQWQISASSGMMRFCWVSKNKQLRRTRRDRVCNSILSHFCVFPIFMCQNYLDCKSDVPEEIRERGGREERGGHGVNFMEQTSSGGSALTQTCFPELWLKLPESFKFRPRHNFMPYQIIAIKISLTFYEK